MEERLNIYILKQESRFTHYDVFLDKNERHYVQYRKHWDELLSVKRWTLEELVGEYEYDGDILKVSLITKSILI